MTLICKYLIKICVNTLSFKHCFIREAVCNVLSYYYFMYGMHVTFSFQHATSAKLLQPEVSH